MDNLLAGLSTYPDECFDAALDLDTRRQAHERRHRRYRLQLRPASKETMIDCIEAVGATEAVNDDDLRHVPVTPVAGGVAFAPRRMTVDMLCDVYDRVRGFYRAPGRVYDRVREVMEHSPSGVRLVEVMALAETPRTSTQRALEQLEDEGFVRVRLEKTRGDGSQRKRYYPAQETAAPVSADILLGVSL